jgi:hypothetical protein
MRAPNRWRPVRPRVARGDSFTELNGDRTMFTKRMSWLLSAVMGLVLLSCGGKNLPPPINVSPQDQVYYSDESRMTEVAEMVIRDADTWRQVWGQVTGGESEPPAVDFRTKMLLLVNGGRMDPGDRIQIDRLEYRGQEPVAMYRVIEAGGTLRSDVFPIQVVAVPRRAGQIRFEGMHVRDPNGW